jgi:hypothetical protein
MDALYGCTFRPSGPTAHARTSDEGCSAEDVDRLLRQHGEWSLKPSSEECEERCFRHQNEGSSVVLERDGKIVAEASRTSVLT